MQQQFIQGSSTTHLHFLLFSTNSSTNNSISCSLIWMISVRSRDERKGLSSRYCFEGQKMEFEGEIEEGEALFQNNYNYDYNININDGDDDDNNDDDDSRIDPDVSLSYIDEKIQNVLGHCQKDFEGGVSAENLGAKFGGYGSFLPTYQRSPACPNPNTHSTDLNFTAPISPNNAHIKAGNQNFVSQSNASHPVRNGPASSRTRSGSAPRRSKSNGKMKQEVDTSCGNKQKSITDFVNDSDQKSLKVRIKMGSDKMFAKGNAEIYSGLGLDVSPSSSMEASPVNSDGFFHGSQDVPDESPTSILEMMTSFPVSGSLLLSPLPYDVLHLTEKKSENDSCGPVHKGSQDSTVTAVHGSDLIKADQNVVGEKSKSTEKNSVSMESTNDVLPKKETSVDNFVPGSNKTSSSGGKRKAEGGLKNESSTSKTKKNDNGSKSYSEESKKNIGKVKETYKDFFGELDLEQEDNEEMGLEKPLEGINVQHTPENNSSLEGKLHGKRSQKPSSSTIGNKLESDVAVSTVVPVVNEDWVFCDKCEKWRLLPPGVNPGSLPERWICSMLDWLPGMNRCSISEEETTKATTALFLGPSVQGSQHVHPDGAHFAAMSLDETHQHLSSQIPSSGVKKKLASKDLPDEAKRDGPSMSSNSSKKKLHTSNKTRSLNGVNQSPLVNDVAFQDSGRSRDVVVEKDRLKQKESNKLCENFADEGRNIHHHKTGSKRESTQDLPKSFKKVKADGDGGSSYMGKIDKRDVGKKRKKINEIDGTGKNVKETSESINTKEKKARVLKSSDEGTPASKIKNIKDVNVPHSSRENMVRAATSSSSKVSGSHKSKTNNQESKGSPVESVSSSPMRILNVRGVDPLTNNVDAQPHEEKSKGGRSKSKELLLNKNAVDAVSVQDSKKPSKKDVSIKGKSNSLQPMGQGETERKENAGTNMSMKALKHDKKGQNQNGNQHLSIKNPTPEKPKDRSLDPTAVLVRDLSNQATTNALREATNLKHMADRVKNAGSSLESRALYMEATLKFLHVASLFESCHSQTGRYGDMIQSKSIYSSTTKLCEYCAHEYERTKETTTASLAYKCMEVCYMKVVYFSHSTANKDVNELQASLHIRPTGESPSSSASASDLDNLNNLAAADKGALVKGVNQVAGNHIIAAKNKPSFTRILEFTQNVNSAMEASRKSRIAFAASSSKEEAVLTAIKRALDFNFHDVEELLHRVRMAMEIINR
ncbi:hypothetical protein QVD17_33852 [Tagetes erecta]|uniref:CW-type domain-containing protein n=1 Tax=Tagetes erecta TaxID=13708 RepID=A0AAD8JZ80_TARER|nr:hypothetical protein QVD17_33852 [Tagetes erecta]